MSEGTLIEMPIFGGISSDHLKIEIIIVTGEVVFIELQRVLPEEQAMPGGEEGERDDVRRLRERGLIVAGGRATMRERCPR